MLASGCSVVTNHPLLYASGCPWRISEFTRQSAPRCLYWLRRCGPKSLCFSGFAAVTSLHEVLIDIVGNGLALGITDSNCARVVHTAPDPCVVPVRSGLRNAGVAVARLTDRCERKRLL